MHKNALKSTPECAVCCAPHDEDIHDATLSVHQWFRHQVTRYLFDEEELVGGQVA